MAIVITTCRFSATVAAGVQQMDVTSSRPRPAGCHIDLLHPGRYEPARAARLVAGKPGVLTDDDAFVAEVGDELQPATEGRDVAGQSPNGRTVHLAVLDLAYPGLSDT